MQSLGIYPPGELLDTALTSSHQSLLQSRKPTPLPTEQVAALFVTSSGENLLQSKNWGPNHQLAVEKGVGKIIAKTGFTVAEITLMTFDG